MKLNGLSTMIVVVLGLLALALLLISYVTKVLAYLFTGLGIGAVMVLFAWWVLDNEIKGKK